MKYPVRFKQKVLKTFKDGRLLKIFLAMGGGKDNKVRYIIEDSLDDNKLFSTKIDKDKIRYEVKDKKEYDKRKELYGEFIELLNHHLDEG